MCEVCAFWVYRVAASETAEAEEYCMNKERVLEGSSAAHVHG